VEDELCPLRLRREAQASFDFHPFLSIPVWETFLKSSSPEVDFKRFFSSPALTPDGKELVIGQGLHVGAKAELVCLDPSVAEKGL